MATEPILIVLAEDDDGHASLVQRNLERAGLTNGLQRLNDGQEALDFLRGEGAYATATSRSCCCWISRCRASTAWKCSACSNPIRGPH
jgi:hypothetical protein